MNLRTSQSVVRCELKQPQQNLIVRGRRKTKLIGAGNDPFSIDDVAILALDGVTKFEGFDGWISAFRENGERELG